MIEYEGYTGVFEFDPELALFAGHVVDLRDEIYFEGSSVDELGASMRRAVDHYLEVCAARGEQPEKPFSGRFNVRVEPDIHRSIVTAAAAAGLSMNEWLAGLIESGLDAIDRASEVLVLDDFRKPGGGKTAPSKSSRSARSTSAKPRAAKAAAAKKPARAASVKKTAQAAAAKPKTRSKPKKKTKSKSGR